MNTIALDGPGWTIREALGETWRWQVDRDRDPGRADEGGDVPATVPGSVIVDLQRAGELPDPYTERNSRAAEWTGIRSWVYRRKIELPPLDAGERAVLEFDGIDPSGAVFWDGVLLGRVDGLYRRGRFPIPDTTSGIHRLAVVVDPLPASQPQVGRTERVRVHRPRLTEGWDFCPRFPHQGLWRPARLVVATAFVAEASVRSELDEEGRGRVLLDARIEADRPVEYEVVLHDPRGRPVAQRRGTARDSVHECLDVDAPRRWYPRGLGEQARYTVVLHLDGGTDPVLRRTVGFRTAELVANAGAPPDARAYTAVVNGQLVPLVGWNWTPVDAQYGAVPPQRVGHLVELAARSGARVLRVWGGGLIETEEFYDACDRAGLLVWQEFSQSSSGMQSAPAADPDFVRYLAEEAATVAPRRTHFPSLLLWDAGNELDDGAPLDEHRSPAVAALREQVRRFDPGRAWLPTSPSGPAAANRLDLIESAPEGQHDVHGPWEHQGLTEQYRLYNAGTSLAHTEFGAEGMANRRALDRLVPPDRRKPADRSNPVYRHLGEWWDNASFVAECFRDRLRDLDQLRRASQLLQASALAYAVEADRRRFPRCSMVLPWQLAESYPNAWCTSTVDFWGEPKPAYHAVARGFARQRVTVRVPTAAWADRAELTAEAWVWAETPVAPGSCVRARLCAADGTVLAAEKWTLTGEVGDPRPVGTLRVDHRHVPADAAVVWDFDWTAADGSVIDEETVLACTGSDLAPLLDLAPAELEVTGSAARVHVGCLGGAMAVGLQLSDDRPPAAPGWLVIDGDPRPLLPGRQRSFGVRPDPPATPRRVRVEAWNAPSVRLDLDKESVR